MNNYTVRAPKTAICAVLLVDVHGKRQERDRKAKQLVQIVQPIIKY